MTENEICLRLDLYRALGQLSLQERQIVILMAVFELSQEETAEALGMSRWSCCRLFEETVWVLRDSLRGPRPAGPGKDTEKPVQSPTK